MDGITEIVESRDEASGLSGFGSAVEVIGAEILVEGAVREHVVRARASPSERQPYSA